MKDVSCESCECFCRNNTEIGPHFPVEDKVYMNTESRAF